MSRNPLPHPARRAAGFTLTELMISLALVLLLVLAMARIFGVTTRAISKGTAVSEVVRGLDATRQSLQLDMTGAEAGVSYDPYNDAKGILPLSQQPAIIISSKTYTTFLSEADAQADFDGDPRTIDRNNDGNEGPDDLPALTNYQTGRRWFRGDRLSFFARGDFKSQANLRGNAAAFTGDVTAPDAWVWYGHGRVYTSATSSDINESDQYFSPGGGNPQINPNNYYASDWILLRNATLLTPPLDHDNTTNQDTVVDSSGNPILHMNLRHFNNNWDIDDPRNPDTLYQTAPPLNLTNFSSPANVAPLGYGTRVFLFPDNEYGSAAGANLFQNYKRNFPYTIQLSRVDVAGVTSGAFRTHLDAIQQKPELNAIWYSTSGNGTHRSWYDQMFASESTTEARFWVNPELLRPLNPTEISQATSLLLPGCTQFIAEYAGDFLEQNATTGALADNDGDGVVQQADGILDFTVDANDVRHTRWYGLPRDIDGDGVIAGPGAAGTTLLQSVDVRPLADYLPDSNLPYPFERRLPGPLTGTRQNMKPNNRGSITDYLGRAGQGGPQIPNNFARYTGGTYDGNYVVAWGPGDFDGTAYQPGGPYAAFAGQKFGPSLIRVVVTAIDDDQRLEEQISQELVFRVPAE